MLTANQPRAAWEAKKLTWPTTEVVDRGVSANPQEDRVFLDESDDSMTVTLNAMEVKVSALLRFSRRRLFTYCHD